MRVFKLYNNNGAFGDGGPFEIEAATFEEACEALTEELAEAIRGWAREEVERELPHKSDHYRGTSYNNMCAMVEERMREEFVAGLSVVCPRCGQHGPPGEDFICGATFGCPGY